MEYRCDRAAVFVHEALSTRVADAASYADLNCEGRSNLPVPRASGGSVHRLHRSCLGGGSRHQAVALLVSAEQSKCRTRLAPRPGSSSACVRSKNSGGGRGERRERARGVATCAIHRGCAQRTMRSLDLTVCSAKALTQPVMPDLLAKAHQEISSPGGVGFEQALAGS